jgi:hypothetical protein
MKSPSQLRQLRIDAERGQPEAQFLLSQHCFENRDVTQMIHWLTLSSSAGLPVAQEALGFCYEKGRGIPKDYKAAITHYDLAIAQGAYLAAYRKAELLYKSHTSHADDKVIGELLVISANANFVPALRTLGFLAMQTKATAELAVHCLSRAARSGDLASAFHLGWFLLQQDNDGEPEAGYWLQQAATGNYPLAGKLLSSLDTVAPLMVERGDHQIQLPGSFALYPVKRTVESQEISTEPPIVLFKHVLDMPECAYLMFLSRPHLTRADVIDPDGHKEGITSNVRTNMSTFLPFGTVDIIGRYAELKIIAETGEDIAFSEPMSILYYARGEYYQPHFDFFSPSLAVSKEHLADAGQRVASAITYLDDPDMGGGTSFPNLDIEIPPLAGSTLWFRNCLADGQPDPRTLHAGDPVTEGEKWVVTKWFREQRTSYLEF